MGELEGVFRHLRVSQLLVSQRVILTIISLVILTNTSTNIQWSHEKYHVIEYGYSIKCKPSYDQDLYNHIGNKEEETVDSPFAKFNTYSANILHCLKEVNIGCALFRVLITAIWFK